MSQVRRGAHSGTDNGCNQHGEGPRESEAKRGQAKRSDSEAACGWVQPVNKAARRDEKEVLQRCGDE